MTYSWLADLVLLTHVSFVLFVILTVPLILAGGVLEWEWVRKPRLRILHLVAIAIVTLQSWAGVICPLTTLEMWLRKQEGLATYTGSFIEHWLQKLLYWNLPSWVFVAAYTSFALLIIATWFLVPPRRVEI